MLQKYIAVLQLGAYIQTNVKIVSSIWIFNNSNLPSVSSHLSSIAKFNENTSDLLQVTDKLYHIILHRIHLVWVGFKLTMKVVIGTDFIGSCKSNYHTIMTTMTLGIYM
jgi:hypothetical protein